MVACAVSVLMCKCPNGELIPTARAPNEPVEVNEALTSPITSNFAPGDVVPTPTFPADATNKHSIAPALPWTCKAALALLLSLSTILKSGLPEVPLVSNTVIKEPLPIWASIKLSDTCSCESAAPKWLPINVGLCNINFAVEPSKVM